jgi:hypothetical protein
MPRNRVKISIWTPLLSWLLWSPKRLAAILAAVLIVGWIATSSRHPHTADLSTVKFVPPSHGSSVAAARSSITAPTTTATAHSTVGVPPASVSSTTAAASTAVAVASPSSSGARRPHPPGVLSPREQAARVVVRWVNLWARPSVPRKKWLADLEPLTFRDYVLELRTVDPSRAPFLHVSGPVRWVSFSPGGGLAHIPVAGASSGAWSVVSLVVMRWHGAWKCTDISKVS